jgi:peptide/nickel transport system ATP-binding protein
MNAPVKPLLEIEDLKTWFFTRDGVVRAVDGVSFAVYPGETLAVVGESGCGKSVTALSILRLIASPPGRIVSGKLLFEDKDLLAMDEAGMRELRGNEISMIFQEPMTSLNPVLTVGRQIAEALRVHRGWAAPLRSPARSTCCAGGHPRAGAARRRIPAPALGRHAPARDDRDGARLPAAAADRRRADDRARRHHPGADPRPDAALKQKSGRRDRADHARPRVVAEMAQRVVVMYAGRKVEEATGRPALRARPRHPYTRGLLDSVPRLGEAEHGIRASPRFPASCRRCARKSRAACSRRAARTPPTAAAASTRRSSERAAGTSSRAGKRPLAGGRGMSAAARKC